MKKKTIGVALLMVLSGAGYAQNTQGFNPDNVLTVQPSAHLEGTMTEPPGLGNVFERDVTPQLREMSRKKSVLELKRIDLEIEKIDMEMHKIQQERVTGVKKTNSGGRVIDATNIQNNPIVDFPSLGRYQENGNMGGFSIEEVDVAPMVDPRMLPMPTLEEINALKNKNKEEEYVSPSNSGIHVLMTYGFQDDLYAKITSGSQGGYVIRKGDILPNGKTVIKVTSNYIEIRDRSHKKAKNEKIFVTGAPSKDSIMPIGGVTSAGNEGSDTIGRSMTDSFGQLSLPGMVGTSVTAPAFTAPPPQLDQLPTTPFTGR